MKARLLLAALAAGCADGGEDTASPLVVAFDAEQRSRIARLAGPPPLPDDPTNAVADDPAAAALGQWLFFDARFSGNGEVSCATCHDPALGFGDGLPVSEGVGTTTRNAPTVLDAAAGRWQFWDGRCDTLWCQATQPWESPVEHGGSRLQFAHLVADDPDLRAAYEGVFGPLPDLDDAARFPPAGRPARFAGDTADDPLVVAWEGMDPADREAVDRVFTNLAKAVAAYERRLVTGPSAFDRFARGLAEDDPELLAALDASQQRGLALFIGDSPSNHHASAAPEYPGAGCHACHGGPTLSDLEFHNTGVDTRDWLPAEDAGRYDGAAAVLADPFNGMGAFSDAPDDPVNDRLRFLPEPRDVDLGAFKTPSLRNVALTAPYMHGGQFETLDEVVFFYTFLDEAPPVGRRDHQLSGVHQLQEDDRADLVAFLEALTGEPPDDSLLEPPASPLP